MAKKKKIDKTVKLVIPAGKATPAPPVGSTLGQAGINIGQFCKQFNADTEKMGNMNVPVVVTIYSDKTFIFELKTPLASDLLKKAASVAKGSGIPNRDKVGKVPMSEVKKIAEMKMEDLNAKNIEGAVNIIMGTARSMGIEIEGA